MGSGGPQVAYVWHLRGLRGPKCHTYATCGPSGRPSAIRMPLAGPQAAQVCHLAAPGALNMALGAPKWTSELGPQTETSDFRARTWTSDLKPQTSDLRLRPQTPDLRLKPHTSD